jgi:hypothetical protein
LLFNHQKRAKEGLLEVLDRFGVGILEGETRSGKTRTALSVAEAIGGPVLVLTTKKALTGFRDDLRAFPELDVDLINYHSVHKLEPRNWSLAILDECHSSGLSSYPKQGLIWKRTRDWARRAKRFLLMSGTVAIESKAQLYSELLVTGKGPWVQYKDFYAWWRPEGHYKDGRLCGGYGVEGAVKSVGSNGPSWSRGEVVNYSAVDENRIKEDIAPYVVTMEREGFAVQAATLIPVSLENKPLARLIHKIKKDKVVEVVDDEGEPRLCVYDKGPASVAQACHMAAGGTLKDVDGQAFVLGSQYDACYRVRWMANGMSPSKQYVIHTAYIAERAFIVKTLMSLGVKVHEDLDSLRLSGGGACVVSLESYAEGVDMSWLDGSQILYSLVWKGAKFSQVCDRQLKHDRRLPVKVAIPLLSGGIDSYVYDAVRHKRNFNGKI